MLIPVTFLLEYGRRGNIDRNIKGLPISIIESQETSISRPWTADSFKYIDFCPRRYLISIQLVEKLVEIHISIYRYH